MYKFSIVTPTYNRAKYLQRIYDCLCKQGEIDFEWIIVNDGSTDDTEEVVSSLINLIDKESRNFIIKYIYKENGGQLSARNTGTLNANSYILAKLDDDDLLLPNVLEKAWNYFDIKSRRFKENCACLSGLCQYENGDIVGEKFPYDYFVSDHIRYRRNRSINGDKYEFYVTEIFKQFPFPIIENEKNMPPHIVHERIARKYNTLYINEFFAVKNFYEGGLSSQKYVYKYTLGSELYYNEASLPPYKFSLRLHHSSRYIYFAKKNKKKNIFKNSMNKKIYLLGFIRYILILIKEKLFPDITDKNKIFKKLNYSQ